MINTLPCLAKTLYLSYETETLSLLDDKPIKVDDVVDICWSVTDSILALLKGVRSSLPRSVRSFSNEIGRFASVSL